MDEKEITDIFKRLRKSFVDGNEPSDQDKTDMIRLAEGTMINLATLAGHVRRKQK